MRWLPGIILIRIFQCKRWSCLRGRIIITPRERALCQSLTRFALQLFANLDGVMPSGDSDVMLMNDDRSPIEKLQQCDDWAIEAWPYRGEE